MGRRASVATAGRRVRAAMAASVVLLAGCATPVPDAAPAATPAPAPAPSAPSLVPVPPPIRAPAPAPVLPSLDGVTLTGGYAPHPHLRPVGAEGGVMWPAEEGMPEAIGDPPVPDGLGPLVITAAVDRWRLSCTAWERRIVGVDVGGDPASARIAAAIVAAAASRHADGWVRWFASEADCEGTDPSSPVGQGNTYQELSEEPCALPAGPPLRCFLLADFGYPAGAAHTYLGLDQLVFDATTGELLDVDDVLRVAGLDPAEVEVVVNELVCRLDGCWDVEVDRVRPTADALVLPFAPYEAGPFSEYTRELTVPWELLVRPDA